MAVHEPLDGNILWDGTKDVGGKVVDGAFGAVHVLSEERGHGTAVCGDDVSCIMEWAVKDGVFWGLCATGAGAGRGGAEIAAGRGHVECGGCGVVEREGF